MELNLPMNLDPTSFATGIAFFAYCIGAMVLSKWIYIRLKGGDTDAEKGD